MRLFIVVSLLSSSALAQAAGFRKVDKQVEKQELIQKLGSDINKVDHSIEVTKELIKKSPDAPYLADLMFRLAELYVERSRYVYARVMEQQVEGEAGSLSGEKALEVQISKRMAIETYTKLLTDFIDYKDADMVRFFRAHEYRELGDFEKMMAEYKELIEKYPKSDWSIEARLILGDYHFDKGDLVTSEQFYNDVLLLPESHMHDMARYKLGWIRINQEKFPEALKLFQDAVSSARKTKRGAIGDAKKLNVKREALMALAWPFSEVKKPFEAPDYFKDLADSKTLYVEALKRLANRYFVKTEYVASALLYREIVALSADVELNIDFVQRIYDSVRNMPPKDPRRYAHAAEDVQAIVDTVARFENHWKFADEEKGALKKDFELRARDLSTRLHVEAKNKGDQKSARIAALAYRQYLSLFVDAKEKTAIETNRAEALYQGKSFIDAAEQYEAVARGMAEGTGQGDLLYSALVSFHEALDADAEYREKNPTKGGLLDFYELLRAREGLKQVGAYYVKTWPKSEKAANVKFNIAKMYYQQGEYEQAAELFANFLGEHPNHKDALTAGNLALDSLNKLDKYDELAAMAKKFVDNPNIRNPKFKNDVAAIGEAAKRRKVELTVIASTDGDFSERMLGEWEKHKDSKEGEDFLYAAFVKFKSEGNVAGVFDFGNRMMGAYPESTRINDVLATMGSFAVRAADYERAAFLFEEFYKRFPKDPNALSVLGTAANIRFALGDTDKAAEDLRHMRSSGDANQQRLAHERLMEIYRDALAWEDLARVAQTAVKETGGSLGALANLGIAYAEQNKDELAERELMRAVKASPRSDFDKASQARALFALGRLFQKQYDLLQFKDAASLEAVLSRKLQLLQGIEQLYVQAIGTGQGEWAIASLQEAARLYQGFAVFIEKAPVPDGLSAQDKKAYEQQLKQNAQQYVQKAQETIKACSDKAEQLKVFTAHAAACAAQSLDAVVIEAKRHRASNVGDDGYKKEVAEIRLQLAKTPENLDALKRLGRRALQVGDYHLAKLALSKAVEVNARDGVAQNLLGVAVWNLGDPQGAYGAFAAAWKERSAAAAANLAALFSAYGYTKLAQRTLGDAGSLSGLDLTAPDYHPTVKQLAEASGT